MMIQVSALSVYPQADEFDYYMGHPENLTSGRGRAMFCQKLFE